MPVGLTSEAESWAGDLRFRGAKGGESWCEPLLRELQPPGPCRQGRHLSVIVVCLPL